jgi:three-Cys-motif partner protein
MTQRSFGGDWTVDKLDRLRKYLQAYTTILKRNPQAQFFSITYVDAFAGTGICNLPLRAESPSPLFGELTEGETQEAREFISGSARIALETEPSFDRFLFVEQDPECAKRLTDLRTDFPERAARIVVQVADANQYLMEWCHHTDWRRNRAVVFLDPFGMEVEWNLIKAIAETRAIDLWLLFPLGVAVNRLLTRSEPPPEHWARALTRTFGTDEWQSAFYTRHKQFTLFGLEERHERQADLTAVGDFFVRRLQTAFAAVAKNPLPLVNSRNVPLYLLCFAAGNPKGAPTAVRIAQDVLRR